jgi:hypothetical protein
MVLVDTSVWVSHFKRGNPQLETLLDDMQVATHDFIIGELACGNLKNRREILELLRALPVVPIASQAEILHFIDQQFLMGVGIGFIDAHLLASVRLMGIPLWTFDRPLQQIAVRLKLSYPF